MAQYNPNFTPPVATQTTELYYAESETGNATQVYGVQGIPTLTQASEDITYRTLESKEEFGAPGIKPFSAIEINLLLYAEQHASLSEMDGKTLWWYVKYPQEYGIAVKWKGKMSYNLDSIEMDDMCKAVLKIYKDTVPTEITATEIPGVSGK